MDQGNGGEERKHVVELCFSILRAVPGRVASAAAKAPHLDLDLDLVLRKITKGPQGLCFFHTDASKD